MIHDRPDKHDARDQKLQSLEERIAREGRVGWPTLTATAIVIVMGLLITLYLTLDACVGR
jgi:hypothetical protein